MKLRTMLRHDKEGLCKSSEPPSWDLHRNRLQSVRHEMQFHLKPETALLDVVRRVFPSNARTYMNWYGMSLS